MFAADNGMTDSLLISSFQEVKTLTYKWIGEIGDKKIKLGIDRKAGTNIDEEVVSLANEEVKSQYLSQARSPDATWQGNSHSLSSTVSSA